MCDTFISMSPSTSDGSIIFGKNSDREPNEAQALEYHPSGTYSADDTVNCTYLSIPQVKETNAVLLCRPFWMWGAEMGANDRGVVIGNEGVFTKMPYNRKGGLTGMDMLRLALERSNTAEQALETIVQLLSDYGQGGICGYEDKKMLYHNSYIIADSNRAWVLETAAHLWAALEIKTVYSISNGLTIGEDFDRSHPDLIRTAQEKKLLKKGQSFHFARCYSDWLFTTFSASRQRRDCSLEIASSFRGKMNVSDAFNILRHHQTDPYRPDSHLLISSVCVHGGNGLTRHSSTTGSLVAHLEKKSPTYWATGTAAPCASVFKPIWFEGNVLPDLGPELTGINNPQTLWWKHEKLHRLLMEDYSKINRLQKERDQLEASFLKSADNLSPKDKPAITDDAFSQSQQAVEKWIMEVEKAPTAKSGWLFRNYWKHQNQKAGIL